MAERFSICRAVRLANPKSIIVADVRRALPDLLLLLLRKLHYSGSGSASGSRPRSCLVGRLSLCVQVDYMIGELVTELKQVQLYEDTTVIFWTCALALALPWLRCAVAYLTWRLMRFQRPWVQAG